MLLSWWLLACVASAPTDAGALPSPLAPSAGAVDAAWGGETLWVSYTVRDADDHDALYVLPVVDGVAGMPVSIPTADVVVGLARKPSISVRSDGEVAVVWSTGDPRASAIWLATGSGETFTVEPVADAVAGQVPDFLDQPEVRWAPDDELWVMWKAQVDHPTMALRAGWRSEGFAPRQVAPFPGRPCECCPHQLDFAPDGDALLTIRNDVLNLREIYVGRADAGTTTFDRTARASTTGWVVQGCPFDGPRMAVTSDDDLAVTWVDATEGTARAWMTRSRNGGATWGPEEPLFPGEGDAWGFPLAVVHDGGLWLAVEELWQGVRVVVDHGEGWREVPVPRPLFDAELVASDRGVHLVGIDEDGAVWLETLSDE